jgi:hypothetical protein
MSTDAFPASSPSRHDSVEIPEKVFDPVWAAWLARGMAQAGVVERRFKRIEIALGAALVTIVIFYTWFGWWP